MARSDDLDRWRSRWRPSPCKLQRQAPRHRAGYPRRCPAHEAVPAAFGSRRPGRRCQTLHGLGDGSGRQRPVFLTMWWWRVSAAAVKLLPPSSTLWRFSVCLYVFFLPFSLSFFPFVSSFSISLSVPVSLFRAHSLVLARSLSLSVSVSRSRHLHSEARSSSGMQLSRAPTTRAPSCAACTNASCTERWSPVP